MTAQTNDQVFYRKIHYSIAGVSGKGLFEPSNYGIQPIMLSTACWRGFHVVYEVRDSMLLLSEACIGFTPEQREIADRGELPFAPGIIPADDEYGQPQLEGLAFPVPYTGGLLLADGFIRELYVHQGLQSPWKYTDVRELILVQGRVTEDHDRSGQMADIRERLNSESLQPDIPREAFVLSWIDRGFLLDYSR